MSLQKIQIYLYFIIALLLGPVSSDTVAAPIPTSILYQRPKRLWKTTNKKNSELDCDFYNGPCYWRQEFTDSTVVWNHVEQPAGLSLNGVDSDRSVPNLVSPKVDAIDQTCFFFDYEANCTFSLIQHQTSSSSPGQVVYRSTSTESKRHGFATLTAGNYHIYFQIEDLFSTDSFISLSNFTATIFNGSACESEVKELETPSILKESNGTFIVELGENSAANVCQWTRFPEPFHKIPEIIVQTRDRKSGVRTNIDYAGYTGFRVCVFKSYTKSKHVEIEWKASVDIVECFSSSQYKCNSGECISRRGICDGHADCLSADDENTELCAAAMGTLAFTTFASTIMTTYLITYRKYVRDIRQVFVDPLLRDEGRLESIHMRELSREAQLYSESSANMFETTGID